MGKLSSRWVDGDEEDPDDRKRKLKNELDQIRKNALERKRDLRNKEFYLHKPKSGFIQTLNKFASQRRKIEEATEITHLLNKPRITNQEVIKPVLNKPRIIKQEVIQPKDVRDIRGFFRAGVKGKELTRPDPAVEKLKNGVLQSDALQLLQSGNFNNRSEQNQQPSKYLKSPVEDDHADLKMEVAKILNNCNSSKNSSFNLDDPGSIEFPFSPVIGRHNGVKKKINQNKIAANNEIHRNLRSQENEFFLKFNNNNNHNNGERYKRRLFDAVTAGINENHNKITNHAQRNNEAARNSTPENVIFYSEIVSNEPVNKIKKHSHTLECSDPDLIKYYVETCKLMGVCDLKNIFRNKYKDPEESAKEALKLTYKKTMKDYVQRQKGRPKNYNQTTPSNSTEVLMEPDSDIARRLKKNVAFQKQQKESRTVTPNNSTKTSVDKVNARSLANAIDDNVTKRKNVPSSSDMEVPSSTQAVADPKSVRADVKMNSIHPDRQEIVARFLEDQKSFISEASREIQGHRVDKEELYINNNLKDGSFFAHKSTKYVPAILRKNRSLTECVAKEKASILSNESYPSQIHNRSKILDIVESERTPNTITESVLDAPKCKYVHMNAKYKQPPRVSAPSAPKDVRYQRSRVAERHSQTCPSPSDAQKNFVLLPTFTSPIQPLSHYSDTSRNFHLCQLSQESKATDNSNDMARMVSFGEIQDRTNRLILCSQNQMNCSQESIEHAYAAQPPHTNRHFQPCASTSNRNVFNNQPHASFSEHQSYDRPKCECSSSNLCCVQDLPAYVPQRISHSDYSSMNETHNSCSCSCCHQKSTNESGMAKCLVPVLSRQPIKYHAAEGNRRQPIYNPNESCSFAHKQPCCSTSRGGESSDFEYLDVMQMNYGGAGGGGGGDRTQSFVPPANVNQRYQLVQSRPRSPVVCQQVVYRHNHRPANEGYEMNDVYGHPMNRQIHSKRQ